MRPVCEREAAPGQSCFLNETDRTRHIAELRQKVLFATTNLKLALSESRVDQLIAKADDNSVVADLFFNIVSSLLFGAVAMAAKDLASGAARQMATKYGGAARQLAEFNGTEVSTEIRQIAADSTARVTRKVGTVTKHISTATALAKPKIKKAFAGNTKDAQSKVSFLAGVMNEVDGYYVGLQDDVLTSGDDATLLEAISLFGPQNFSVEACRAAVDELLNRFDANRACQRV